MAIAHRDIGSLLRKHGYTELKKIGEGSFGKAILVQSDTDGTKLVCKMVDVSSASAKETQDAVKEGKLLAAFKHPYVVRYRESFIDTGWLCILMDYCEGGDLTKIIETAKKQRKPIPEDQVLRWMTQALLALKYIHDKHVLHRDLKSGNFFLSKASNLKMGDFGIAKVLSCTAACAKTQIGTPYYLSPEVCQEKPYTWPSDIWAMGCIFYELCERKVPFDAANISGLVQKICRGPTPMIGPGYSDFVRNLCSEMLNRNPNLRPSAETILQRPAIQDVVRQMLDEAQAAQQEEMSKVGSDGAAPARSRVAEAPLAPVPGTCGPYAEAAGSYRKGDLVEYHSSTHKDWLPAAVTQVDGDGQIIIDLKPNTWIPRDAQAAQVRPRRREAMVAAPQAPMMVGHGLGAPVGHMARQQSVGADPGGGAPMRRRSPSLGAGVGARERGSSPSRAGLGPVPSSGSRAGSRAGTPSRGGRMWSRDPSPPGGYDVDKRAGSRGGTPIRGASPGPPGFAGARAGEPLQVRPPGMPGLPRVPGSPVLQRPSRLASVGGMAIAGV